jgi:gliding motility-associatede transport system auxiliary component
MELDRRNRLILRLQHLSFVLLVLLLAGLLAMLSLRHSARYDWTVGQRNTLSPESAELLNALEQVPEFIVFAQDPEVHARSEDLLARYREARPDIVVEYVNPDLDPERARQAGVRTDGETLIRYGGDQRLISSLTEYAVSNALQALARSNERFVVMTTGHGEREPYGQASQSLGALNGELSRKGYRLQQLNLTEVAAIPDNASLLVIASPRTALFAHEMALIDAYLRRGGNLLYLADPGDPPQSALLASLGVAVGTGQLVDSTAQLLGLDDPTVMLAGSYDNAHPVTQGFDLVTVFPGALSVQATGDPARTSEMIVSQPSAWLETSQIRGEIRLDEADGDVAGPLPIMVSVTRSYDAAVDPVADGLGGEGVGPPAATTEQLEQRIIVAGDGDFMSNAFLGSGGNLELTMDLFNWLSGDDEFLDITVHQAPDRTLTLSDGQYLMIGSLFLFVLPGLFLVGGGVVWFRRRSR